jgi:hypothetical protein
MSSVPLLFLGRISFAKYAVPLVKIGGDQSGSRRGQVLSKYFLAGAELPCEATVQSEKLGCLSLVPME